MMFTNIRKGACKYSVAYDIDGQASYNYPFTSHNCGPPLLEGDVLGVGYKPRTGTVFFTRNGRRIDPNPYHGAFYAFGNAHSEGVTPLDLFPTVGSTGAAVVHVNFGQAGFVFVEANVKKWGLAPMSGTLAPPPAYGNQTGSLLLESNAPNESNNDNNVNEETSQRPLTFDERRRLERRLNERLRNPSDDVNDDRGNNDGDNINENDPGVGPSTSARNNVHNEDYIHKPPPTPPSLDHNPPTPNFHDIRLNEIESNDNGNSNNNNNQNNNNEEIPPPHYAPIDPQRYPDGVSLADIPVSVIICF